jgi:ATP-dependent Lon protease
METSFIVGREASIKAVQQAGGADSLIFLVVQRNEQIDLPAPSDLYQSGVIARILENRRLPDENLKVTVRGLRTATIVELRNTEGWFRAKVSASSHVEHSAELTSALASVFELLGASSLFELLGASSLSVEDRQKLLERWDYDDPWRWIAKCLPAIEKAD